MLCHWVFTWIQTHSKSYFSKEELSVEDSMFRSKTPTVALYFSYLVGQRLNTALPLASSGLHALAREASLCQVNGGVTGCRGCVNWLQKRENVWGRSRNQCHSLIKFMLMCCFSPNFIFLQSQRPEDLYKVSIFWIINIIKIYPLARNILFQKFKKKFT